MLVEVWNIGCYARKTSCNEHRTNATWTEGNTVHVDAFYQRSRILQNFSMHVEDVQRTQMKRSAIRFEGSIILST